MMLMHVPLLILVAVVHVQVHLMSVMTVMCVQMIVVTVMVLALS